MYISNSDGLKSLETSWDSKKKKQSNRKRIGEGKLSMPLLVWSFEKMYLLNNKSVGCQKSLVGF